MLGPPGDKDMSLSKEKGSTSEELVRGSFRKEASVIPHVATEGVERVFNQRKLR
eukprot:m.523136 g.523136  ORF g.523136 m.523136 type:complete len:54 (-) comp21973_c0_seq21:82-243(-)